LYLPFDIEEDKGDLQKERSSGRERKVRFGGVRIGGGGSKKKVRRRAWERKQVGK